jgi:hypothetical protein
MNVRRSCSFLKLKKLNPGSGSALTGCRSAALLLILSYFDAEWDPDPSMS